MRRMYISLAIIVMGLVLASCMVDSDEQPVGGGATHTSKATSSSVPSVPGESLTASESENSDQAPSPAHSSDPAAAITSSPAEPVHSSTAKPKRKSHVGELSLFYVAIGDDGQSGEKLGCGDSLVMDTTGKIRFKSQLKASFDRLLANHERRLGQSGLYNALWQSRLKFVSSSEHGDTVTVNLHGQLQSGGTCDDPRIMGQLKRTATVAAGLGKARVRVNGKPVRELLSAR